MSGHSISTRPTRTAFRRALTVLAATAAALALWTLADVAAGIDLTARMNGSERPGRGRGHGGEPDRHGSPPGCCSHLERIANRPGRIWTITASTVLVLSLAGSTRQREHGDADLQAPFTGGRPDPQRPKPNSSKPCAKVQLRLVAPASFGRPLTLVRERDPHQSTHHSHTTSVLEPGDKHQRNAPQTGSLGIPVPVEQPVIHAQGGIGGPVVGGFPPTRTALRCVGNL